MTDYEDKLHLLFSDASGIYIPQRFANEMHWDRLVGAKVSDLQILQLGPDHEEYWEAWAAILDHSYIIDGQEGIRWNFYQDGDVWAVRDDMTEEELSEMFG